jgi:hypothetical protein
VTAQRANGEAVAFELLLELLQGLTLVQHRQFAMGVARIVAGTKFYRMDIQTLQFFEYFVEGELCEQRSENSDLHGCE